MSKDKADLRKLFGSAVATGVIGAETSTLLSGDLGAVVIAGAAGRAAEDIVATDVTLITFLLDKSSSIRSSGLIDAVRQGYNAMLDTLLTSREGDSILVASWLFDDEATVLHSYVPVADAVALDDRNYRPSGATHLYDVWCDALAANVAYAQQLRDGGTPTRSVVVVITDGYDVGSRRGPEACEQISRDLLASEQFALAFVGVGEPAVFHGVARSMGIPEDNIALQADATPRALREMFELVSQSAIMVTSGRAGLTAGGGFFN